MKRKPTEHGLGCFYGTASRVGLLLFLGIVCRTGQAEPVRSIEVEEVSQWQFRLTSRADILSISEVVIQPVRTAGTLVATDPESGEYQTTIEATVTCEGDIETTTVRVAPSTTAGEGVYCERFVVRAPAANDGEWLVLLQFYYYYEVVKGLPYELTVDEYSARVEETTTGIDSSGKEQVEIVGISVPVSTSTKTTTTTKAVPLNDEVETAPSSGL